jgi:Spy/CpxP family protein refolding chaperone
MRAVISSSALRCGLFTVLLTGSLLVAQDKKSETKPADGVKKSQNRLPQNYGKLNLAEDQRKKILDIQAGYDPKIDELNAQLEALKEKQRAEVEAVLTPDQLKQLATIKAEAKKKSDDEKAAKAKGKGKATETAAVEKTEPAKKVEPEKKPVVEKKP